MYLKKIILYVSGPPNPPRDLFLTGTCLNFSANLTWTTDRDSYNPVTNFTIQWSTSRDTTTWYDVANHVAGSANGHVVRGLQPFSNIVFRVIAENRYGRSLPSGTTSGQECKTAEASKFVEFSHNVCVFKDPSRALTEQLFFSLYRAYNLSRRCTRIR